ncbi:unnamed protein product [Polarella glacialis]|jgi:hypothetical protein|uniref:Uncharacterized protein n=1 Tax=Polarella glacialis TaxID=89957 RepID=A0A813L832_POLGL|nr:unnamed protein product [Polarella glacialis]
MCSLLSHCHFIVVLHSKAIVAELRQNPACQELFAEFKAFATELSKKVGWQRSSVCLEINIETTFGLKTAHLHLRWMFDCLGKRLSMQGQGCIEFKGTNPYQSQDVAKAIVVQKYVDMCCA